MGGLTHVLANDLDACRKVTDELHPLAERNRFSWPLVYAKFQRAWIVAEQEDRNAGIEQMIAAAEGAPAAVLGVVLLTLIARQQMLAGRADAALATLDRAVAEMNKQANWFYHAEIVRLRGDILLALSRDNTVEAERIFREAMAIAARQPCRPLELRAATSLARLLGEVGRGGEARELLARLYGAFTEGFDMPDLLEATAVLAELS